MNETQRPVPDGMIDSRDLAFWVIVPNNGGHADIGGVIEKRVMANYLREIAEQLDPQKAKP